MNLDAGLDGVERQLLDAIQSENLLAYTAEIAREPRLSGSAEELRAFRYIAEQLTSWGLQPKLQFHDGFVSWPRHASLQVAGLADIECITHSMSASTEATSGEIAYVGAGRAADYSGRDVAGKIVLIEGLAAPVAVREAIRQGSSAQIFINDGHVHEMITSAVWGNPTPDELSELPTTPCVSVTAAGGNRIKERLQQGATVATLTTRVDTGWRSLPLLSVDIEAPADPDKFVLFSGHVDSWHLGAMDNGGANACMMEIARLMHRQRHTLERSLRICFWSGHSHGRYAGSAWYADRCWDELRRNCVAHVYIDSVGGKGATLLSQGFAMSETRDLGQAVIGRHAGAEFEGTRPTRSGDQSFISLGIPSLLMTVSEQPPAAGGAVGPSALIGGRSGGLGYWWHTVEDTVDKLDPAFLARDCRLYLATLYRLCAEKVLPFNYERTADELLRFLEDYQRKAAGRFDLSPALSRARTLREQAAGFSSQVEALRSGRGDRAAAASDRVGRANEAMIELGRALIPVNYTTRGPFGQDLALPIDPVPALAGIKTLAGLDPGSPAEKHLKVELVRRRNMVCHALDQALAVLTERQR